MVKLLLTLTLYGIINSSWAQNTSVEKSTFGIQVGAVGVWIYNEARVANSIALRSEIGLRSEFKDYTEATLYLAPVITLEPRWYYNLKQRNSDEKNTFWNSGNFVTIKLSYVPDWFFISIIPPYWGSNYLNEISIIPTWGIRRNIRNHFNYEAGLGIGWEYVFKKDYYVQGKGVTGSFIAINLHFRVGYRF